MVCEVTLYKKLKKDEESTMRKMLLLGDSINLHYASYLNDYLSEDFIIHSKPGKNETLQRTDYPVGSNGRDSAMVSFYKSF